MVNFNEEYFSNNCYFFLKEGKDKISLYYSVGNTITESRKKDEKKDHDRCYETTHHYKITFTDNNTVEIMLSCYSNGHYDSSLVTEIQ